MLDDCLLKMRIGLNKGNLARFQAEITADSVRPKPDHSVSVDLEDLEYLPLI